MPNNNNEHSQVQKMREIEKQLYVEEESEKDTPEVEEVQKEDVEEDVEEVVEEGGGQGSSDTNTQEKERETLSLKNQDQEKDWESEYQNLNKKYQELEHKWKSREGALGQRDREINTLKVEVQNLRQTVSDIQKGSPKMSEEEKQKEIKKEIKRLITDNDKEEYGEEMIDLMKRAAKEVYEETYSKKEVELSSKIKDVDSKVENIYNQKESERYNNFIKELNRDIPDLQEINKNPDFKEWVNQVDPRTGKKIKQLVEDAIIAFDKARVEFIIGEFKKTQEPKKDTNSKKQELENHIQPSKSKTNTVNTKEKTARRVTRAEIKQFYLDKQKGKYTAKQSEAMEKIIEDAVASGNVI